MNLQLTRYRHPETGFEIDLPASWDRAEDPRPGIAVIALEPDREPWFRANVVVTVEELAAELDLTSWQAYAGELLPRTLNDFILLDLEQVGIADQPAVRRLAHHATEQGAVTMEQWAMVAGGLGYTLTASIGTLEYLDLADLFTELARGFRPDLETQS